MSQDKVIQKLEKIEVKQVEHDKQFDWFALKFIETDEKIKDIHNKLDDLMTKEDGQKIVNAIDNLAAMTKKEIKAHLQVI